MIEIIMILLPLLIQVESGGNASAIGDSGNAIGCLQIHKIFVDDVNRLLGKNKYSYSDRLSCNKSKEMATIYLKHYAPIQINSDSLSTLDKLVILGRQMNGGPTGHLKVSTTHYAAKLKLAYERSLRKK